MHNKGNILIDPRWLDALEADDVTGQTESSRNTSSTVTFSLFMLYLILGNHSVGGGLLPGYHVYTYGRKAGNTSACVSLL